MTADQNEALCQTNVMYARLGSSIIQFCFAYTHCKLRACQTTLILPGVFGLLREILDRSRVLAPVSPGGKLAQ